LKVCAALRRLALGATLLVSACHHGGGEYIVAGSIAGLTGDGLVLQNNGADDLAIDAGSTAFQFPTEVDNDDGYDVTVLTQPERQTCTVTDGSGVGGMQVTSVQVTCAEITHTVTASSGGDGSISPDGTLSVSEGGEQEFTATPDSKFVVSQWLVDGAPVQDGGEAFTLSSISADHTVEVTFTQATLLPSVAALALSVNDTAANAALTGAPRQIVLTNTGPIVATNVSIAYPVWPAGTTASSTCTSALAAGASCSITITPGATATSNCGSGVAPTGGTITVSADDAADSQIDVSVLSFGCLYQGGYVYAIDDTTPATAGIGGSIVSQSDQVAAPSGSFGPPGIVWSSTSANAYDGGVSIWGIDQTSTAATPSPNATTATVPATQIAGQQNCDGRSDGPCNTNNIVLWYGAPNTTPAIDPSFYGAGVCTLPLAGHSDWYLPAVCEMGPDSGNNICPTGAQTVQNMADNLPSLSQAGCAGSTCLNGNYWTSTEEATIPSVSAPDAPKVSAWIENYVSGIHAQGSHGKAELYGVRCARKLTP
jgi:hypothetical protein